MAILVPNGGEVIALEYLVNKDAPENLILELFVSNTTPAEADVIGTYTLCTETGYSNITLTGASWTSTEGAPSDVAFAEQTFTFTGSPPAGQTIYGYLYKRATGGELVAVERAATSFTTANNGDQVKVTPAITAD